MDFELSPTIRDERDSFKGFLNKHLISNLARWNAEKTIPRRFYRLLGDGDWYNFTLNNGRLVMRSAFREGVILEEVAKLSPGVAVTLLVHVDLGLMGLCLFGSETLQQMYGNDALKGNILICLGNTERQAGSDVANVSMRAEKIDGGWQLNGTKSYVTNGLISDMAVMTAVSDPPADRNKRLSMFLVDLNAEGVKRTKLNKQVWIPSDLTRIQLMDVFVPDNHLMGEQGRGLQQVLSIFTHSRVAISAMTLGTAVGAFEMALNHAKNRKIFETSIVDFQSKAFEMADFYAQIEAARLMIWKACSAFDNGPDFCLDASIAKYLSVNVAKAVSTWAADLFGAASVIYDHPIHKYPMDAWASSLGEGTQDVQKLVIFRELMKRY